MRFRRCDARCMNSLSHICECSCGGKNHGIGNTMDPEHPDQRRPIPHTWRPPQQEREENADQLALTL